VGQENGQPLKLGVAVLEHSHGLSLGAGMQRLIDYETFDLTRGCLVRSAKKKIKKYWHSWGYLQTLLDRNGECVDLKPEELNPLLEFYFVNEQRENYDLTEEQAIAFSKPDTIQNPLLLEILSSASAMISEIVSIFEQDDDTEDILDDFFDDDQDEEPNNEPNNEQKISEHQNEVNPITTLTFSQPSPTQLETLQLHQQGLTIEEIAASRNIRPSTVIEHLAELIERNQSVDINQLMPPEKQSAIWKALQLVGENLNPIRNYLGESYSFDEIRLVRALWRRKHQKLE
jgi:DNA-binding CsgD family transcriptional regulator